MAVLSRRVILFGIALPVAFAGSCFALTLPAMRLADPLTRHPVETRSPERFPILIVSGDNARVLMLEDPGKLPPLPEGATYLVPDGREESVQRAINEQWPKDFDSSWVVEVERHGPDRQHIRLYLIGDGYWGGAYDATASSVTPRYRKSTGPGFAFIGAGLACLVNATLWGLGAVILRTARRRRAARR